MPDRPLTLAIWQQPGLTGEPDAMIARLTALFDSGALSGTDLLLLPELWTTGYMDARAVTNGSECPNGPYPTQIAALARTHGVAIAFGYPEHAPHKPWNAAQLIDSSGQAILHYRKVNLWGDYERDLFTPGNDPSAIADLNGWRIGFSICYDTEYPETLRDLALRGADLVLAPAAVGREFTLVGEAIIRVRAAENGVWLAFANRAGTELGYPFDGQSAIVAPDGTIHARAHDDEALLIATLDPAAITAARQENPYLHDIRWSAPSL